MTLPNRKDITLRQIAFDTILATLARHQNNNKTLKQGLNISSLHFMQLFNLPRSYLYLDL